MIAMIFVACFSGCLLALSFVIIIGYQIVSWIARRWIKNSLPALLHKVLAGEHVDGIHPKQGKDLADALRDFDAGIVRCAACKSVELHLTNDHQLNLPATLEPLGWRFDGERFDGWGCPKCVALADTK
jgi:hypothetical protein